MKDRAWSDGRHGVRGAEVEGRNGFWRDWLSGAGFVGARVLEGLVEWRGG